MARSDEIATPRIEASPVSGAFAALCANLDIWSIGEAEAGDHAISVFTRRYLLPCKLSQGAAAQPFSVNGKTKLPLSDFRGGNCGRDLACYDQDSSWRGIS